MSQPKESLGMDTYQPMEREQEYADSVGLTVPELLQYLPSQEEIDLFRKRGYGLIDIVSLYELKSNTLDSLRQIMQIVELVEKSPQGNYEETIKEKQKKFIRLIEKRLNENRFPGKDFSVDIAREILDRAKSVPWTEENLRSELAYIRSRLK